jgi:hypothetical protein
VLSDQAIDSLHRNNVFVARIFAKLNFADGESQFISTGVYEISDYETPLEFLRKLGKNPKDLSEDIVLMQIYDKFNLDDMKFERKKVVNIETVWIRWYKD